MRSSFVEFNWSWPRPFIESNLNIISCSLEFAPKRWVSIWFFYRELIQIDSCQYGTLGKQLWMDIASQVEGVNMVSVTQFNLVISSLEMNWSGANVWVKVQLIPTYMLDFLLGRVIISFTRSFSILTNKSSRPVNR